MCVYCGADISIRTSGIGKCKFTDPTSGFTSGGQCMTLILCYILLRVSIINHKLYNLQAGGAVVCTADGHASPDYLDKSAFLPNMLLKKEVRKNTLYEQ